MVNKIILASASPRRAQLLSNKCAELIIIPQNVDESNVSGTPSEIVMTLSRRKLGALPCEYPDIPVVASDTIVWYNGKIYGKPYTDDNAIKMLRELSGKTHEVYTGYAVAYRGKVTVGYDSCKILFRELSDSDIESYVATGSPLDKAGAYGIQDGVVVKSYDGDINTIVGLPVDKVIKVCEEMIDE